MADSGNPIASWPLSVIVLFAWQLVLVNIPFFSDSVASLPLFSKPQPKIRFFFEKTPVSHKIVQNFSFRIKKHFFTGTHRKIRASTTTILPFPQQHASKPRTASTTHRIGPDTTLVPQSNFSRQKRNPGRLSPGHPWRRTNPHRIKPRNSGILCRNLCKIAFFFHATFASRESEKGSGSRNP